MDSCKEMSNVTKRNGNGQVVPRQGYRGVLRNLFGSFRSTVAPASDLPSRGLPHLRSGTIGSVSCLNDRNQQISEENASGQEYSDPCHSLCAGMNNGANATIRNE
jgi:hypothetical protein